jgi:hypothetical protein
MPDSTPRRGVTQYLGTIDHHQKELIRAAAECGTDTQRRARLEGVVHLVDDAGDALVSVEEAVR